MRLHQWITRLSIIALLLAFCVIALGAYTRLKDAGLGCPDWPGCYGHISVPQSEQALAHAQQHFPKRPLEPVKAWAEMIHRYFASSLGSLILIITVLSFRAKSIAPDAKQNNRKLPLLLLALVIFQGLLGMWTVTLGLFPTVVMGHLLGGFSTVALIFLLVLNRRNNPSNPRLSSATASLRKWLLAGIALLGLQIALGGWTAANYAATVCTELPICQSGWQGRLALQEAFQFWGHEISEQNLDNYEYGQHLSGEAKITIHVAHRIGAIIVTSFLVGLLLFIRLRRSLSGLHRAATISFLLLITQICLGISNVFFGLPLAVAVAHNAVAALLLLSLIYLAYRCYQAKGEKHNG